MTEHATVTLEAPGDGHPIEIDVDLAPLIAALWTLGVRTSQCCQESQPGFIWVAFPDSDAALDFLRAIDLTDDAPTGPRSPVAPRPT